MKTLKLLWIWFVSLFGQADTTDETEEQIMALCREAHSRGWRFAPWATGLREGKCGCPFQAMSWMRGNVQSWGTIAREFGIYSPGVWGGGFDAEIEGARACAINGECEAGARIARRLKAEGLA